MGCCMEYSDSNKKNKLQMNLLSLINPSLAYVYCTTVLSNYGLVRLNKLVSQISLSM